MWQTSDMYIILEIDGRRCRKMDLLFSQEVKFLLYVCQFILCIFGYSKMFTDKLFIYNYKTHGMLNAHLKFSRTLYKKMAQFSHD